METILDELSAYARMRVERAAEETSIDVLKLRIANGEAPAREPFCFEKTLKKPGMSFLCEVKKASPSKGIIAENFPYLDIARAYEVAGADCISCLTEPKWFLGSDKIFTEIRSEVKIPMLRKDFTVSAYQLYEAKLMGADAVLLICAILSDSELEAFLAVCEALGLSALVETHDETEMKRAADVGARIVGVNNRNLKDFSVDMRNSERLRTLAPKDAIFVAESGIRTPEDVAALRDAGVDAVLIGETLMRARDKSAALAELRGAK